jgi:hypothetical protein
MPTVKISSDAPTNQTQETVSVKINPTPAKLAVNITDPSQHVYEFKLNLRRALNGDLMIFDHADVDIIILTEKKKIVAFPKDMMSDIVYGAENRLFNHLRKKGVVAYDSIQGGSVYGSLEGLMLEMKGAKEPESIDYVLYQISEWMNSERPYFEANQAHDDMMDDALLNPDDETSTELGDVPHEEEKGSIKHGGSIFGATIYGRHIY